MANVQNRISQLTSENNSFEFHLLKAALNKSIQGYVPIKQPYVHLEINKNLNLEINFKHNR